MIRLPLVPALLLAFSLCCSCYCVGDDAAQPDARPDETPQCDYHGTLYDDGELFPAGDGCNTCKCNPDGQSPGEFGCSLVACFDAGSLQCDYHGTLYDDGELFPAGDGCNTCKCNPDGQSPGEFGCSLVACFDAGASDAGASDAAMR